MLCVIKATNLAAKGLRMAKIRTYTLFYPFIVQMGKVTLSTTTKFYLASMYIIKKPLKCINARIQQAFSDNKISCENRLQQPYNVDIVKK